MNEMWTTAATSSTADIGCSIREMTELMESIGPVEPRYDVFVMTHKTWDVIPKDLFESAPIAAPMIAGIRVEKTFTHEEAVALSVGLMKRGKKVALITEDGSIDENVSQGRRHK